MQLVVDPPTAGAAPVIHVPVERATIDLVSALDAAQAHAAGMDAAIVHLWIHDVDKRSDAIARDAGFAAHRDLWQLRCPLPVMRSELTTRSFTAADADDLVAVNNRAFHWHPEQSGMTHSSLMTLMDEPWFDPDGLRLFHEGDELIGFCWTKVHPAAPPDPELGEIFVIAIDPSAHGRGLGSPMTRSGLDWLADLGLTMGMLYVESDNHAANRVYERIGFFHHRTDRAYHLDAGSAGD